MITFVGGSKFAKGGPNPLANMDSWGSISASGFGVPLMAMKGNIMWKSVLF